MVTVTMKEASGYELHEEQEWYEGTVVALEDLPDGNYGPGVKWIINLDGELDPISGGPRDTWAFCSQTLSPRSKLYKWAKGILGEAAMPQPGETFDLARLVGQRVKVMFEHTDGLDGEGNPTKKEKVVSMKASQAPTSIVDTVSTPTPAPAPAAAPAAPDTEPY